MWQYQAPLRDMRFVLEHWLQAPAAWSELPAFAEVDLPLALQVLEEAARFSSAVLAPLNASGDRQGCSWREGCLLYTSPSPRDQRGSRMPSSA